MGAGPVTLFLCGDVMVGRGVDQILPHPGDPELREPYVRDARGYVELAEAMNGPIPCPVDFSWPWGEALDTLDEAAPDLRVPNLETSITRCGEFAPGKSIHYRMNPANLPCLTVVRPDVCVLANNHVLDFGRPGLVETLTTLAAGGLRSVGAGHDLDEVRRPAVVPVAGGGRALVVALGTPCSGVPLDAAAGRNRPGIDVLPDLSDDRAAAIIQRVRQVWRPGDIVVVSLHWGSNWGYDIPVDQIRFAHALIDGGVDVVYGHSSHHPRPIELYRGRLILYGCGDLINDYEGISGYEEFRDDLRVLYFATVAPDSGALAGLRLVPMRARRMRLEHASPQDIRWLGDVLDQVSHDFGVQVRRDQYGGLAVHPR